MAATNPIEDALLGLGDESQSDIESDGPPPPSSSTGGASDPPASDPTPSSTDDNAASTSNVPPSASTGTDTQTDEQTSTAPPPTPSTVSSSGPAPSSSTGQTPSSSSSLNRPSPSTDVDESSPSSTMPSSTATTMPVSSSVAETTSTSETSREESTTTEDTRSSTTTVRSSSASTTDTAALESLTASASPSAEPKKDTLSTGQIIGVSLAGVTGIGVVLVMLGTLLKFRRKRATDKATAHLRTASQIWDFADPTGDVDGANEKAASESGGMAPFRSRSRAGSERSGHGRQGSAGSAMSSGMTQAPAHQPKGQQRQAPMERLGKRLSELPYLVGMRPPAPQAPPPPLPMTYRSPPVFAPAMPAMGRQDSFGSRAYQATGPPAGAFYPPPAPAQGRSPYPVQSPPKPLVLPGGSPV